MLTITQYEQYVDGLPRAAHDMEHITNFGKIVARGFMLLASSIERSHQRTSRTIAEALGGNPTVDTEAARAKRAAERQAKERALREQLAALESEDAVDTTDDAA
jgi:hypothetical protein